MFESNTEDEPDLNPKLINYKEKIIVLKISKVVILLFTVIK